MVEIWGLQELNIIYFMEKEKFFSFMLHTSGLEFKIYPTLATEMFKNIKSEKI